MHIFKYGRRHDVPCRDRNFIVFDFLWFFYHDRLVVNGQLVEELDFLAVVLSSEADLL